VLITGPLVARDTQLMADAVRALGCRIEESPGAWHVEPPPRGLTRPHTQPSHTQPSHARPSHTQPTQPVPGAEQDQPAARPAIDIDVGNAGTVLRFVPPLAALADAEVKFTGDPRVAQRPVGPLLAALRELGAAISDDGSGAVPFTVHGHGSVAGGRVTLDASASSQLVSGLLLAAARFEAGAEIRHVGPPVPSAPHIEMTVAMLRAAGVRVTEAGDEDDTAGLARTGDGELVTRTWRVWPGPISASRIDIEPDLSNAVPFLAAALATGGEVTVADWPADSLQPAGRIIELLRSMGADARRAGDGLRVTGSGRISGVGADLSEVGELAPVLTALAALATSPSEFTGIGHLRKHESDRLAALAGEIGKLGGDVTETADGLRIRPAPLHARGVSFDSHDDHRLVMAAAVLGLVTDGLRVRNAGTVGKTFPDFSRSWARILAPA
jgi:3-phosphoshikimate 1-carboxyvinyltransferase